MKVAVCDRCDARFFVPPIFEELEEMRCGACFGGHIEVLEENELEDYNE